MTFDFEKVKHILVCPESKSELVLDDLALVSTDPQIRLRYPIEDGIPRLLAEEATQLTPEEWATVMKQHHRCDQTGRVAQANQSP